MDDSRLRLRCGSLMRFKLGGEGRTDQLPDSEIFSFADLYGMVSSK